ncbi:MAG: DUF1349 domain-containing protein [Draconibacterium sp.]|nr:DUF1349 domain-containing protein [Draconibacterium sp.]
MAKYFELTDFKWINKPDNFNISGNNLTIDPKSETDLWQRTYYGFRNDNAPMFVTEIEGDFTFTVKAAFDYKNQYDQCGIVLYDNNENWVKVSVEQENETFARLGSVVTKSGYSDWATTDIGAEVYEMWYCLSRRGQDYYIEYSTDGKLFKQMRMLHFPGTEARVGVYACSPVKAGFKATFSEFKFEDCRWQSHK